MIEMAIALPLFCMALFGLFEVSIMLMSYCSATYACGNAARYAGQHSSASLAPTTAAQIQSMVKSALFLPTAITPTITLSYVTTTMIPTTNTIGNLVEVSVTWSQPLNIPFASRQTYSITTQTYAFITH